MKSAYNKQRRSRLRKQRDMETRRARRIGLEEVPKDRRLKQKIKWGFIDRRPNKMTGHEDR